MLISPEKAGRGWIADAGAGFTASGVCADKVDFAKVIKFKQSLFNIAYENFKKRAATL